MSRTPDRSPQTVAVLCALLAEPAQWRYGYDLAKTTSLASGTLYPILARLAARGYLDRQWEADPDPGRPPRHLYRLTPDGLEFARAAHQQAAQADADRRRPPGAAPHDPHWQAPDDDHGRLAHLGPGRDLDARLWISAG